MDAEAGSPQRRHGRGGRGESRGYRSIGVGIVHALGNWRGS